MQQLRTPAFFVIPLFFLIYTSTAFALSIRGTPSVDRIEPNGVFEWTVSVEGTSSTPQIGNIAPFQLVGGPSTSTQISIVNGSITNSIQLTYALRAPAQPGTYNLPTATIQASGQTVSTAKTTLQVVDQGQGGQPGTPAPRQRGGQNPQQAPQATQHNANELAWIEASTSDRTVFVGERVRVTYRIFFQSARNLQITDMPQGSGFSMENAREIREYKVERAERNGRAVNSSVIYDVWVTPTRAGTIEVPPMEAQVEVVQQVQRRNDPFGMFGDPFGMFSNPFGNAQIVPVKVKSPKVVITAKPLPGGRSASEAWVGNYSASVTIAPQELPVHQSATIVLNIKGGSQLRNLATPELSVPGSIEAYPAQVKIYGDGEQLRKEVRYPVIPRAPGKYSLTFQPVTVFDPGSQNYRKILTDTLWLTATGTAGGQAMAYVPLQPNTMAGQDNLPLPTIERTDRPLSILKNGWYLSGGMILAGLVGMGFVRHRSGRTVQERTRYRGIKKKLVDKINEFNLSSESSSEDIERILSEYLTNEFKSTHVKIAHPDHLQSIKDERAAQWMEQWKVLRDLRYQPSELVEGMIADWKKAVMALVEGKSA